MREAFEFIKKLWQNKRTRALAILILYVIFFIFVFSFISSGDNKNSNDKFYYLNNIEIINYTAYDSYNNVVDYYNKELINGTVIYKLVKSSMLESTNYIDNSNTYYISVKDYERIINNVVSESDEGIRITVSDNNIILDFTNYYGYKIKIDIRS